MIQICTIIGHAQAEMIQICIIDFSGLMRRLPHQYEEYYGNTC